MNNPIFVCSWNCIYSYQKHKRFGKAEQKLHQARRWKVSCEVTWQLQKQEYWLVNCVFILEKQEKILEKLGQENWNHEQNQLWNGAVRKPQTVWIICYIEGNLELWPELRFLVAWFQLCSRNWKESEDVAIISFSVIEIF